VPPTSRPAGSRTLPSLARSAAPDAGAPRDPTCARSTPAGVDLSDTVGRGSHRTPGLCGAARPGDAVPPRRDAGIRRRRGSAAGRVAARRLSRTCPPPPRLRRRASARARR